MSSAKKAGRPDVGTVQEEPGLVKVTFKADATTLAAVDALVRALPASRGTVGRRRSEAIRAALVEQAELLESGSDEIVGQRPTAADQVGQHQEKAGR